jgi:hypothetical protein
MTYVKSAEIGQYYSVHQACRPAFICDLLLTDSSLTQGDRVPTVCSHIWEGLPSAESGHAQPGKLCSKFEAFRLSITQQALQTLMASDSICPCAGCMSIGFRRLVAHQSLPSRDFLKRLCLARARDGPQAVLTLPIRRGAPRKIF